MLTPQQVLDQYYPEVRAWLIQIGAVMDRYDRADHGDATTDERLELYQQALKILASDDGQASRAAKIQMLYSDPYEKE